MAEHFCQFIIKWPETQDDTTIHCDQPAPLRRTYTSLMGDIESMWVCVTHFDEIEDRLAAYRGKKYRVHGEFTDSGIS